MRGSIRQRGPRKFQLKLDIGRDAAGKRQIAYHAFIGSRREAEKKLAELVSAVGQRA
jgi:hypothetical protein